MGINAHLYARSSGDGPSLAESRATVRLVPREDRQRDRFSRTPEEIATALEISRRMTGDHDEADA